jgi:protein-serine/threonine kinase
MGLPYDARATDAWACGVVLFALLESRLPFDIIAGAPPGARRGRVAHRIARCEWSWAAGENMPPCWDPAKDIVERLLRRRERRIALTDVQTLDWVRGGIDIPGGLRCADE